MHSSKMPVPTWDAESLYDVDSPPLANNTAVPDDIWNKFDLDSPIIDNYHCRGKAASGDSSSSSSDSFDSKSSYAWPEHQDAPLPTLLSNPMMMMQLDSRYGCSDVRKIRHHDCMWAGLCVSKEHSRAPSAKRVVNQRVPAGRSLLIAKNTDCKQSPQVTQQQQHQQQLQQQQQQQQQLTQQSLLTGDNNYHSTCRAASSKQQKNLESDGDSTRPPTPQSSIPEENSDTESEESEEEEEEESDEEEEEEEEEEEDEVPIFRHDQISINGLFSARASEVTGQRIQRPPGFAAVTVGCDRRIKEEIGAAKQTMLYSGDTNTHLMSDHCYHLNQQPANSGANKKLDHLGVQTPSDSGESEEEIDVVNFDKPVRPESTALTLLNPAEQHHFNQLTVSNLPTYKEHHRKHNSSNAGGQHHRGNSDIENAAPSIPRQNPAPRPRGRPPLNPANRKRQAANDATTKTTKRARNANRSTYQRKSNAAAAAAQKQQQQQQQQIKVLPPSPSKSAASSDDEPDTEKRSMHNNMERQRRVELRQAFEMLRLLVPAICDKEKAPKVAILRQSAHYCDKLTELDAAYQRKLDDLRREQDRLKARASQLRRLEAMRRGHVTTNG